MHRFALLPPPIQALLAAIFTCSLNCLGGSTIFLSKGLKGKGITFMTGCSAGIMISAGFFSLLLPAIEWESKHSLLSVVSGFLFGGVLMAGADVIFGKLNSKREGRSYLMLSAVTLHNIPEGLAVGIAFSGCTDVVTPLLFALGIGIQNFPEGACVAYALKADGFKNSRCFLFSSLSGLIEGIAAVAGGIIFSSADGIMPFALAFSAGAMIAVVCSELIPEAFSENKRWASAGVIFGFTLMMFLDLAL